MGKPIREFESRPLRKQKGDTFRVALIVCRKPSSARGRKADGEQLGGLAKQRPFCLQGRPRQRRDMQSRSCACVHKDEDGRKRGLAQQGLFCLQGCPRQRRDMQSRPCACVHKDEDRRKRGLAQQRIYEFLADSHKFKSNSTTSEWMSFSSLSKLSLST